MRARKIADEAEWVLGKRTTRVVGLLTLLVVVVVALLVFLNWYIAPEEPGQRKDLVLGLAQILGGTALLSGLYFTWRTLQVNREGQITDRFTRAIDQLGSTDDERNKLFEIRLGGIYALERIAKESPEDHWPIMEILTAYVRQHARRVAESPDKENAAGEKSANAEHTSNDTPQLDPDIQAIITVIRRRTRHLGNGEPEPIDLHETDLRQANLEGADLREANLLRADLLRADLREANLQGAILIEANLEAAKLQRAQLGGAKLREVDLVGADLGGANLRRAQLAGANLFAAWLREADFGEADLGEAKLWGANLGDARLVGADLGGANLGDAYLRDANLREAYLGRAYLGGAKLRRAKLWGADLRGADLRATRELTLPQLAEAVGDGRTRLPDYIDEAPASWGVKSDRQTEGDSEPRSEA